jgi:hypothetical protein
VFSKVNPDTAPAGTSGGSIVGLKFTFLLGIFKMYFSAHRTGPVQNLWEEIMRTFIAASLLVLAAMVWTACEESSPTDTSKPGSRPTVQQLVGTYRLSHFKLEYENGTTITDATPGVSVSGTMTISKEGNLLQTITVSGKIENYAATIEIKNDSIMGLALGAAKQDVKYHWDGTNLTLVYTFQDADMGVVIETDQWQRTSLTVQSNPSGRALGPKQSRKNPLRP